MIIFRRALNSIKKFLSRSTLRNPDEWFQKYLERNEITNHKALMVSTYYACNKVLAETISTLPLKFYERTPDGGREEYSSYFLAKTLKKPNVLQNNVEFLETMVTHINMRGNHYAGINFASGYPSELVLMNPLSMKPLVENGKFLYRYYPSEGTPRDYQPWQILHNKNFTIDGFTGISPIKMARSAIDLALESEKHGYSYFKNGSRTSGFLKHPGILSKDAQDRLKKSWVNKTTDEEKFKVQILEENMEFKASSLSNEDSQYLQTRQFEVEDVARFLRVPLELIGHPAKTASYNSVEQFMLSFVIHSIRPWLVKTETNYNSKLVPEEDQDHIFCEFTVDGLLRGDVMTRYRAYQLGRAGGWLSPDDIRAKENQKPLPNGKGKIYLMPLNMEDVNNPRKRKGEK